MRDKRDSLGRFLDADCWFTHPSLRFDNHVWVGRREDQAIDTSREFDMVLSVESEGFSDGADVLGDLIWRGL